MLFCQLWKIRFFFKNRPQLLYVCPQYFRALPCVPHRGVSPTIFHIYMIQHAVPLILAYTCLLNLTFWWETDAFDEGKPIKSSFLACFTCNELLAETSRKYRTMESLENYPRRFLKLTLNAHLTDCNMNISNCYNWRGSEHSILGRPYRSHFTTIDHASFKPEYFQLMKWF